MSSTLADNNLSFQKIGHFILSPKEKAEAEKQNEIFRMEIRNIASQSKCDEKME